MRRLRKNLTLSSIHTYQKEVDSLYSNKCLQISLHILSVYKAPSSICKSIEKLMRNFLREGAMKNGGSHLVRCDYVTLPKDKRIFITIDEAWDANSNDWRFPFRRPLMDHELDLW